MGVKLLPPDINTGFARFAAIGGVDTAGKISFGLTAVKNVGRGVIDSLVAERDKNGTYKSMGDFVRRLDGKDVNKRAVESLIKAGAFDSLGGRRAQYLHVYKNIIDGVGQSKKRNVEGQISFFDLNPELGEDNSDSMPDLDELPVKQILANEKEVLGIYVSGHPLSEYNDFLAKHVTMTSAELTAEKSEEDAPDARDGVAARVGGVIANKTVKYTKNGGKPMAFLTIEDIYGALEVVVFPQTYEKYMNRLTEDGVIVVKGRLSVREEEAAKIICEDIIFYDDEPTSKNDGANNGKLWIKIPPGLDVNGVTDILSSHKGDTPVIIYDEQTAQKFRLKRERWVKTDERLIEKLKAVVGQTSVILK
jgi:DNA polymerase-3 subunit alpha